MPSRKVNFFDEISFEEVHVDLTKRIFQYFINK